MAALLVALTFSCSAIVAGLGWSRHARFGSPGIATLVAAGLAALVVLTTDIASLWRYSESTFLLVWLTIVVSGWIVPAGTSIPEPRERQWPDIDEALIMGVVGIALAAPMLVLPVPLDTDAQGFGYLALTIRNGGSITNLAPWHAGISYLYSPGALLIFAGLSRIAPMSSVMMGASHAAAFFFIWMAWEVGGELAAHDGSADGRLAPASGVTRRWRWAAGISAALSVGLWTALLDSHYSAIFALLFESGCLLSMLRFKRTGRPIDAAMAVLFLAAVVATHPDTTVGWGLGLAAWLAFAWVAVDRPSLRRWLAMAAVPGLAVAVILPWLIRLWPLAASGLASPYTISAFHWRVLTEYHGYVWPALALTGVAIFLPRRSMWALAMAGWLLLIVDASTTGLLERLIPPPGSGLFRFDYPFSLAWHAPILPYMILSAGALARLADVFKVHVRPRWIRVLASAAGAALALSVLLKGDVLRLSKGRLALQGTFATANDVAAMLWLRDHSPVDARVLNYPGDYATGRDWEGHWAPVLTERDSVYFRRQPFFLPGGIETVIEEQADFLLFWRDPADPALASRLKAGGIRYVLVPDGVGDPSSLDRSWRWRPPARVPEAQSQPGEAPYLELVFEQGGAQVFRLQSTP